MSTKDPIDSLSPKEKDKLLPIFILVNMGNSKFIHIGTDLKSPTNSLYVNYVDSFGACTIFNSITTLTALIQYIKTNYPEQYEKIRYSSIQTGYSFFTQLNKQHVSIELKLEDPVVVQTTETKNAQTTSPSTP